ncbi:MAG: rhodanese-like domain-containing protein [Immundisolibacteraceae bacterium]|jgi:rhodanese-related sulfurtransferase|nr:rhodanese-like domain-containing protein [Immundisolibacteraceae bacterium]
MMKKGIKELVADAEAVIETISAETAIEIAQQDDVELIDIRDIRELQREGTVPGAKHAPRGMLEFWVDPDSPYHKPLFASGKKFVLYCASGWRSALATRALQEMGLEPVCHISGGFTAWKKAGGSVEAVEKK